MLRFELIRDANHTALVMIKQLYENAFPLHERRTWAALLSMLTDRLMRLEAVFQEQSFIGFVIYWNIDKWWFIEHIAIEPVFRAKQLGTQVIRHLKAASDQKLLLETELPVAGEAIWRVRFYEKQGLIALPFTYFQPPYRKDETEVAMLLMATTTFSVDEYEYITNRIRGEVYERFY